MPLPCSPACSLSRTPLEANRPTRDRQSFRAARKVRRRVAESAAQSGSGRSARSCFECCLGSGLVHVLAGSFLFLDLVWMAIYPFFQLFSLPL